MALLRGRYRYRLVVDGRWITDPHNQYVETNQFGELNNVIEVEFTMALPRPRWSSAALVIETC